MYRLSNFDNQYWAPIRFGRRAICLLLLLMLLPLHVNAAYLYFYNPESNINDFRSLKTLFNRYLSSKGKYKFQPFKNKRTFERFLKKRKHGVFLLSSWHYQSLLEQGYSNLIPILVGTNKGKSTYTKILTTRKYIKNIKQLRRKRIASAGDRNYTKNTLESMATGLKVKILPVPKDIDALMSVLFGMAQGALTSHQSLKTLATINKRKYRLLRQHAKSKEIMLPLIVVHKPISKKTTKRLLYAVQKMSASFKGRAVLGKLGWNGWKRITKTEKRRLMTLKMKEN